MGPKYSTQCSTERGR